MALHVDPLHTPSRPTGRLVLIHGFTQNAQCWGRFASALVERLATVEILAVDAPGHGRTPPVHDQADLWEAADLVVEAVGPAAYLGYSMGGRIALHAALSHPDVVESLILIGATAGLDSADERQARRESDESLAQRLESEGLESFLQFWLGLGLFDGLDEEGAARSQRLTNRADGLAASLRRCGTGTQPPLWDRLGEVAAATLVVAGTDDQKFTEIGHRLTAGLERAEFAPVPGSHPVHLVSPEATAEAVTRSL